MEIKVLPVDFPSLIILANRCCKYLGIPMSLKINHLATECNDNIAAMLMRIQFASYGSDGLLLETVKMDQKSMDIFACSKFLLEPPSEFNTVSQEQETVSFEKYEDVWNLGGERINNIVFNSFPEYLPWSPQPDPILRKAAEQKRKGKLEITDQIKSFCKEIRDEDGGCSYFTRDMDTAVQILDGFSGLDAASYFPGEEMFDNFLQLNIKCNLQDIRVRSSKSRKIDIKSQELTNYKPSCLALCACSTTAEMEKLEYVNIMQCQEAQKKEQDYQYKVEEQYQLSNYIAKYYTLVNPALNQWMIMDLFPEIMTSETGEKLSKQKYAEKIHPKLQTIQYFSHVYPLEQQKPLTSKPRARIKLSSGEFFVSASVKEARNTLEIRSN